MSIPNEVAIHLLTLDFPPVSPPKPRAQIQGSPRNMIRKNSFWFVLRATYNRGNVTIEKAKKDGIKTYVPMHYVQKVVVGKKKKKRIQQPQLPNFLLYMLRENKQTAS